MLLVDVALLKLQHVTFHAADCLKDKTLQLLPCLLTPALQRNHRSVRRLHEGLPEAVAAQRGAEEIFS